VLLLSGARDWDWLSRSSVAPTVLIGLGAVILAATLWPERTPRLAPGHEEPSPPQPPSSSAGSAGPAGATTEKRDQVRPDDPT
jgi:hypothetical protein